MKPLYRWVIAAVVVVIGVLLLLWMRRDQPGDGEAARPPAAPVAVAPKADAPAAPKPEPVPSAEQKPAPPPAPKAEEPPVTATVLFDFDRATLRPEELPKLDALAERIKGKTFDRVTAAGYAGRIGTEAYNLRLSEKRAEAVRGYLAGKGVDAGRIRIEAQGERAPATGDACKSLGAERAANRKLVQCLQSDRRVEIEVIGMR